MKVISSSILTMLLAIVTIFSNCTSVWADKKLVTVTDLGKRSVEAPLGPERIVCLSSGTLRLISMLGAVNKVVGVEDFEKTFPAGRPYILANPDLTKLPSIGPGGPGSINKEPDLEALLKVKPDVIFISYMEPQNADALQKKLGIPVVILSHGRFASFDELAYESLRVAGEILGAESRAEGIVTFIDNAKKDLNEKTQGIDESNKPRVYAGAVGYKGVQGIESSDAAYIPLEWNHARNLAKSASTKGHVFVDKEQLLGWNPDLIFLDAGGLQLVRQDFAKKSEFYGALKAFKDKKVFILYPFNYYVTNIGTAIADAYAVGKILYPDKFQDIDPKKKADEIFTFLYGKQVYSIMEKDFGPLVGAPDFLK
jgi:iron complex transport system substrate-binding protein